MAVVFLVIACPVSVIIHADQSNFVGVQLQCPKVITRSYK
jgi:hypothetical protein